MLVGMRREESGRVDDESENEPLIEMERIDTPGGATDDESV
jgi:hypothetical protein